MMADIVSRKLLKSVALFSTNTLLSRLLGFVRDMVFAQVFGASTSLDAFVVAFRIPNFMRRLFAEGAFSQAFVPILSDYHHTHSQDQTARFIADVMGSLAAILLVVTLLGILLAPWLTTIFAPGFAHGSIRHILATQMLRITFPYLLLISLVAVCAAVLNSYGSFGIPAFAPVFLNVSLITSALYLAPKMQPHIHALAWGVSLAGIVQLLFLLPFLYRKGLLPCPRINFRSKGVQRVLKLMAPAIFGVSVAQVNLLLDNVFASFLQTGSVSWLYYSERLMMFPLGIFGVAVGTVMLPTLSRHSRQQGQNHYSKTLDWALRLLLLVGLPATVGLFFLAGPLLSTLFQYKAFSGHDVLMARQSLMAFAVGLQAFMMIKVLAAAFYAYKDIKTPVRIAVVAMVSNILLNLILIVPLKHTGIALATSLSGILNVVLLWQVLKRRQIYHSQHNWRQDLWRLVVANVVMALFLFVLAGNINSWLAQVWTWRLWHLLLLVLGGVLIYGTCLWILRVPILSWLFDRDDG